MEKVLHKIIDGHGSLSDVDLLWDIQSKIEGKTICPLGDAAAWPVASAIRHFRAGFEGGNGRPLFQGREDQAPLGVGVGALKLVAQSFEGRFFFGGGPFFLVHGRPLIGLGPGARRGPS